MQKKHKNSKFKKKYAKKRRGVLLKNRAIEKAEQILKF